MAAVCRRASEPHAVQHLWAAIRAVRAQKQIASEERIIRHVRREHDDTEADTASVQLHYAVGDGLIVAYHAHQQKPGTAASEQIAFRIPDEEQVSRVKELLRSTATGLYSTGLQSCAAVVVLKSAIRKKNFIIMCRSRSKHHQR